MKDIVVTGIQPTGSGYPHLGNYFGAIKRASEIVKGKGSFVMIADVHATTVDYDPKDLREASYVAYASLIASGVPEANIFLQSMVPEHFELSTILSHFASVGVMERMTQYKDKTATMKDNDSIGFGLLNYPILMAADILAYNATTIPVGVDQDQHIQLTAQLARKVNNKLGYKFFNIPKALHSEVIKIKDILNPNQKMSKSAVNQNGVIYLNDSVDAVKNKLKRATTDSEPSIVEDKEKLSEGVRNLITILSQLNSESFDKCHQKLVGKRYSDLKSEIASSFEKHIVPMQKKINSLLEDKQTLSEKIIESSNRARLVANKTVSKLRDKLGLGIDAVTRLLSKDNILTIKKEIYLDISSYSDGSRYEFPIHNKKHGTMFCSILHKNEDVYTINIRYSNVRNNMHLALEEEVEIPFTVNDIINEPDFEYIHKLKLITAYRNNIYIAIDSSLIFIPIDFDTIHNLIKDNKIELSSFKVDGGKLIIS